MQHSFLTAVVARTIQRGLATFIIGYKEMQLREYAPNPIDIHVGARVRIRRKFQGHSQSDLAKALGLTFQQVQKYERGSNRISASKLYEIARFLTVPIVHFFNGYETGPEGNFSLSNSEMAVSDFLNTSEGIQLAEAFPRIKAANQRRKILSLVQSLADDAV